jgi:hypothetical protein
VKYWVQLPIEYIPIITRNQLCYLSGERRMKQKKKKIEVKTISDILRLSPEEQPKWNVAVELGLFDKVVQCGWKSLTSKESGQIGGILSARKKIHKA